MICSYPRVAMYSQQQRQGSNGLPQLDRSSSLNKVPPRNGAPTYSLLCSALIFCYALPAFCFCSFNFCSSASGFLFWLLSCFLLCFCCIFLLLLFLTSCFCSALAVGLQHMSRRRRLHRRSVQVLAQTSVLPSRFLEAEFR